MTGLVLGAILAIVILVIIATVKSLIIICPPNRVAVISGRSRELTDGRKVGYRAIRGGRTLRVPLLERVGVPVAPRAQWPQGLDRLGVTDESGRTPRGNIPEGQRAEEGRALARSSDLGWAGLLRQVLRTDEEGRAVDSEVPDALGRRIVEVLAA